MLCTEGMKYQKFVQLKHAVPKKLPARVRRECVRSSKEKNVCDHQKKMKAPEHKEKSNCGDCDNDVKQFNSTTVFFCDIFKITQRYFFFNENKKIGL